MSTPRSILCHVDASPQCAGRLALARALAAQEGAELTALYATTSTFVAMPFAVAESSAAGQAALELDASRRNRARAIFDKAVSSQGCSVRWEQLDDLASVERGVVQRALCSDLLVLGQRQPDVIGDLPSDFVESVIAESGKPALVLPYTWDAPSVGERVLVAWNASRESARALSAAMHFLTRAKQVDIVVWDDGDIRDGTSGRSQLTRYLDTHGVPATLHWYGSAPRDIGNALLSLCADLDADLLVMGCYGHSRAREWVLGGTSRTVLQSMTVPALMSH